MGRVGGSAHVNGGLWGSTVSLLPAGKSPQKLSEDSSVQEKDADSKVRRHN